MNVQIFWSPLLIGHVLLSIHGSGHHAVALNGQFWECAGKIPRDVWPPCGLPSGRSIANRKELFNVPWTGSRFYEGANSRLEQGSQARLTCRLLRCKITLPRLSPEPYLADAVAFALKTLTCFSRSCCRNGLVNAADLEGSGEQ
jgi:hypothetical protein